MYASHGSMGSAYAELRFAPEDIPALAKADWSRVARRVFIDPAQGLIALMSPSSEHEGHARGADILTNHLATAYGFLFVARGSRRWPRPGDPENTGAEPDAWYYLGEKALAWQQTPRADLLVEVERILGDEDKPAFYRDVGVPEMWRIDVDKDGRVEADILDLQAEDGPTLLSASTVLPLCTPAFVQEALGLASEGRIAALDTLIAKAREAARDAEVNAEVDDSGPGL